MKENAEGRFTSASIMFWIARKRRECNFGGNRSNLRISWTENK
jgi:hypothetical protein